VSKICVSIFQGGSNRCATFSLKVQKLGLGLSDCRRTAVYHVSTGSTFLLAQRPHALIRMAIV